MSIDDIRVVFRNTYLLRLGYIIQTTGMRRKRKESGQPIIKGYKVIDNLDKGRLIKNNSLSREDSI